MGGCLRAATQAVVLVSMETVKADLQVAMAVQATRSQQDRMLAVVAVAEVAPQEQAHLVVETVMAETQR
jgi:hypothetical protein